MRRKSQTVLCVDYAKGSLAALKSAIEKAGYTVVVADTLRYATVAISIIALDFILLNDKLPERDARDIINSLEQVNSSTPIIVFSHRTAPTFDATTALAS